MAKEVQITVCIGCKGRGFIEATASKVRASCIYCNGKGHTAHGSTLNEADQTLAFKIVWDYLNGKTKGWYH
tara:strand:- start:83 stop:295 length:213 start_codon:yes stop_codon:yes gene_type:complete